MSSSNLERLAYIKEITLGVTPVGPYNTMRYISETMNGNPVTVESQESKQNRSSGGVYITGLDVAGSTESEFSGSDTAFKPFLLAGLMAPAWIASTSSTSTFTIDNVAKTIVDTAAGTDLTTLFVIGDLVTLKAAFTTPNINKVVYISAVTATTITYVGELTDETATAGATLAKSEYAEIGGGAQTTKHSFTIEKSFLDLSQKSIDYIGSLVNGFVLNFEYGSLAGLTLNFVSQNWAVPLVPLTEPPTVVNNPDTDLPINSSGDMGTIIIDGVIAPGGLCFQSLNIELTNNLTPQTCLSKLVAQDFTPGQATVNITASLYLGDNSFQYIAKKLTNTSISISGSASNADGGIGFFMPKVILNTPDPQSSGPNTELLLQLTGQAIASDTQNALRLYWL
ncbi:MAG: phage tail tube protein [Bacteriovoracales bacterium]